MLKMLKPSAVALLLLVLQLGMVHAAQHDLHAFDPFALTIEHDEGDCLLADTPQAAAALPPTPFSFACAENAIAQNIVSRHAARHYPKDSPRAPPVSL